MYISINVFCAILPLSVCSAPINTRSDLNRSFIAVPSAKNSGFDIISKFIFAFLLLSRISLSFSAVLTGNVDFSTIILSDFDAKDICLAQLIIPLLILAQDC